MKYCIVTCIFNDYDFIREPLVIDKDCDYFLFTDNKDISYDGIAWKVIYLKDFDTAKLTGVQKTYKLKYSIYKYIPDLRKYEYIVRIDSSIQINNSLNKIVYTLKDQLYDISIGIHPYRTNCKQEYSAWKRLRNLDQYFVLQYEYFNHDVLNELEYKGLCENTIQIYRCCKEIFNFLDDCYSYINQYNKFKDANDQCYFTDILYLHKDKLRICWHSNTIYIDGYYMTCYEHKTWDKRIDPYVTNDIMFNRHIYIHKFE